MTEPLTLDVYGSAALITVDLWDASAEARVADAMGGVLPALGRSAWLGGAWRAIRVEPTVWWLAGARADLAVLLTRLETALGDGGGAVDLTGGFTQVRIAGEDWRELLTVGGVFDAEDPAFAPGCTAGTILHHVAVRYDVVMPDEVRAYVPPSYVEHLLHHWRGAAARLAG